MAWVSGSEADGREGIEGLLPSEVICLCNFKLGAFAALAAISGYERPSTRAL